MLTEMAEYGHRIKEEVKAMQNEIKENVQGTNSDKKEIRTQINDLDQKKEINILPEQNEETRIHSGMQTGAATVENTMEFPQKTKNGTAF